MKNKHIPEIRFIGFSGNWEQKPLTEFVGRITRKNKKLESTLPLTISAQYGLVDQGTFFNKTVASANLEGYYLLYKGEFAYNKSYSNGYPFGAIKRLEKYDMGVLSSLYICFKALNSVSSHFLAQYFESTAWHKEISMISVEGARNHGLLNISVSDFFDTLHVIPALEEQKKVGYFLKQLGEYIALHQQELTTLKQTKQGFLQKMFPKEGESVPEVRFPGFIGEWEQHKLGDITESYSGGTPSVGNKFYYGGKIPFIRSGEINSESTEIFITDDGFNNSSAKMVEEGDILYALYGATSGEVGISKIHGAINQAILAIKPKFGDDSYFITQWLKKQKNTIINTYLQGGQGNLSGSIVKDLFITLPTHKGEQVKIGELFKQLDDTIALYQRELDTLKETKKAFLQKMFV